MDAAIVDGKGEERNFRNDTTTSLDDDNLTLFILHLILNHPYAFCLKTLSIAHKTETKKEPRARLTYKMTTMIMIIMMMMIMMMVVV